MFGRPKYALSAETSRIWKFSAVAFTSGLKKYNVVDRAPAYVHAGNDVGPNADDQVRLEVLAPLLRAYPDIGVEIISEYGLTDIVAERYDAGVRLGEQVDQDMISIPLAEDFRFAVVAAPSLPRWATSALRRP